MQDIIQVSWKYIQLAQGNEKLKLTSVRWWLTSQIASKWQEQQIGANPESTLGPSSTIMMELSNICFVLVFECGQPGLQSSTLPLSVRPSRGGRPRIELSENDKLFLWDLFFWICKTKCKSAAVWDYRASQASQVRVYWSNRSRDTTSMKRLWNDKN